MTEALAERPRAFKATLIDIDTCIDRPSFFQTLSKLLGREISGLDEEGKPVESVELFVATKDIAETKSQSIVSYFLNETVLGEYPNRRFFTIRIEPNE